MGSVSIDDDDDDDGDDDDDYDYAGNDGGWTWLCWWTITAVGRLLPKIVLVS